MYASPNGFSCVPAAVCTLACRVRACCRTQELQSPPRAEWRASSSAASTAEFAIDGSQGTRWGSTSPVEQWLQVDLGKVARVGGTLLRWDSNVGHRHTDFVASYRVLASSDGRAWQTVYETTDGSGDLDYMFLPEVRACYLRLMCTPLSPDWGVTLFEFEPLAAAATPRLEGLAAGADPRGSGLPARPPVRSRPRTR